MVKGLRLLVKKYLPGKHGQGLSAGISILATGSIADFLFLSMFIDPGFGKIIILNGASSAGKSTLCEALQKKLDEPFLNFSLDFFMFNSGVLPQRREARGAFSWPAMRAKLFNGYFNCLSGLATAGNNLLVDYIIESDDQLQYLTLKLGCFDTFLVGVHCPLEELERRELARGDRSPGDAKRDLETVHTFTSYDFEIDSRQSPDRNAGEIISAWSLRKFPAVMNRLYKLP
ncbi:chloramphenicol phosphotransferase CPT family protein [Mucilaginibacter sp. OK098]|uniref:chloramphenicol phosphotransferase CPT family protein n=1 Tax=Mucilaginibacter sp. OK098 TaxID=1855297 RepID=UPI00092491EE|nr:AAA family ATPase [Mucilaginibacter sp. OK098]SHN37545.1 chloramphenicol 3-O phosphotransferase [Mucilaginibacter sp. OK098]